VSAANPLQLTVTATGAKVTTTTLAATAIYNANEDDAFVLTFGGPNALVGGDAISVAVYNSSSVAYPMFDLNGLPYQVTNVLQALVVPGGRLYVLQKGVTTNAQGIDVLPKPRIGFSGA